ncbi:CvpA family protein [Anaerosporobacter faecicola]|uniref:CvpA family protein n=1 Tax=Anaerosporobacter faecicola TaxID=2718714 RepID=UPI001439BF7B|nr:CvpA family protein [Anaerosporobacter faecicola]
MNWLVIAVAAVLAAFAYKGRKTGFIKTVFSIFSIIIAIVVSSAVSPYVSKTLRENEKFYNYIYDRVEEVVNLKVEEKEKTTVSEQTEAIDKLSLPESIKKNLKENKNNSEVYKALHVDTFKEYVNGYIATLVINAISFLITYVVITVILIIICGALNIISKLPIINGLNKTAGLLVGVFEGLLVIWLLCIILTAFSSTQAAQNMFELIQESRFLSSLYNNNLLLRCVTNMAKVLF